MKILKSLIKLRLDHSTEMPELDITETYSLRLSFEQLSVVTEKDAERTIKSGPAPILTHMDIYRKTGGRTTKLDIDALEIKELFVDWFDQLVSA